MARRALILVEGTRSNGLLFVQAAQRLGLHPITLSADLARYDYLAAESIEAIRVDTDHLDALIRECSRLRATYAMLALRAGGDGLCDSWQALTAFRSTGTPRHEPPAFDQQQHHYAT